MANSIFWIGDLNLGPLNDGDPNPGPKGQEWHKVNVVVVEQIPGKDKKFVTVRTSDKTLWECTLTVKTVTDERYQRLKLLCQDGGPYKVISTHEEMTMYITDFRISMSDSDKEPPVREQLENGTKPSSHHATWTIQLLEAND